LKRPVDGAGNQPAPLRVIQVRTTRRRTGMAMALLAALITLVSLASLFYAVLGA
jgi:hypothetical protein